VLYSPAIAWRANWPRAETMKRVILALAASLLSPIVAPAQVPAPQKPAARAVQAAPPCSDAAACARQCEQKIAASCHELARMHWYGEGGASQDPARSVEYDSKACELGDAPGCSASGDAYRSGRVVPRDDVRALALFTKGCQGGDGYSCTSLGLAYDYGQVTRQDIPRAFQLYQKACQLGDGYGCTRVGMMLAYGRGGAVDYPQAVKSFEQACNAHDAAGCVELGRAYKEGRGVPNDDARAAQLFDQVCNEWHMPQGCGYLGSMYLDGRSLQRDEMRALGLFKRACDDQDAYGCSALGRLFAGGRGAEKDPQRAANLFEKGCSGGDLGGCYDLGRALRNGTGVPKKDPAKALELFRRACEGSYRPGCVDLALAYVDGVGVAKDDSLAFALFTRACPGDPWDDLYACDWLGYLLQYGRGAPPDQVRAVQLFEHACQPAGALFGCSHLAYAYANGIGAPKNEERAVNILQSACDYGDPPSCDQLGFMLLNGRGTKRDDAAAARRYREACKLDPGLCAGLAGLYEYGRAVKLDEACAFALYRQACDIGNRIGCEKKDRMLRDNPKLTQTAVHVGCPAPGAAALVAARMPKLADRYALVVGISGYGPQAKGIENLRFARRDAEEFYNFLTSPRGGAFPADHVRFLVDEQATSSRVRSGLSTFLGRAGENDLVLIYLAGHGIPDQFHPNVIYFLTYDADPNDLGGTAMPMSELSGALNSTINSKYVAVFADACHSGAFKGQQTPRAGLEASQAVNNFLVELSRANPSVTIFSASRRNEYSFEDPGLGGGHGVFTYFLLEGLRGAADRDADGIVTLQELINYVTKKVAEATDEKQHPDPGVTVTKELNLPLAVVPVSRK
jgi:uncharacterized protein